jgi:hypothetical protein
MSGVPPNLHGKRPSLRITLSGNRKVSKEKRGGRYLLSGPVRAGQSEWVPSAVTQSVEAGQGGGRCIELWPFS